MKFAILFLLIALMTAASPVHKPALSVTISSNKKVYKNGELPKIEVGIINNSSEEVYLIGSLDGSDLQWRMPYCYFSIEKPSPDSMAIRLRCGNTNPLRLEDFIKIGPTQKFNPYQSIDSYGFFGDYNILQKETFNNPGTYRIRFHYSTNSTDIEDFKGPFGGWSTDSLQIKKLFEKVPRVELTSDELVIEIEK